MARKKGKEQDSRAALLDAAWQLLLDQGAGGMSVEAIVTRANLSKGTFFHFFPTKQDLLDALCARIADESWQHSGGILQDEQLDPVTRLDRFLQVSRAWRAQRSRGIGALWQQLVRDENAALLGRARSLGVERLVPAMTRLLVEASERGQMTVSDAEVLAPLVVEWIFTSAEGSQRLLQRPHSTDAVDLALRRVEATLTGLERLLGMADHSLGRVDRAFLGELATGLSANAKTKG